MFRSSSEDEIGAATRADSAVANYVVVSNDTGGAYRQIKLTLRDCPLTIADTGQYGSVLLATLPEGFATILGGVAKNLTFKTTSIIANTLNSGVTVQWGVGTVAASGTTLYGSMVNLVPGVDRPAATFVSSTVINVAPAAASASLFDIDLLDGSATALPIYLNAAVAAAGDIDGDATLVVSGTITLTLVMTGDA